MDTKNAVATAEEERTQIIKQTSFENLLESAKQKRAEFVEKSVQNTLDTLPTITVQRVQEQLVRTIISVYFFLRTKVNFPPIAISLEEFEVAEAKLKEMVEEKVATRCFWFIVPHYKHRRLKFFRKHHCFRRGSKPFGKWFMPDEEYSQYYNNSPLTHLLSDGSAAKLKQVWDAYIPPNIEELLSALFKKRGAEMLTKQY